MTHEDQALFLADEQARRQIIENIHTNIFVEASAGSGKTYSLVERMLSMVKSGIPIHKICAITFTKAAANEFQGRFQKRLHECLLKDTLTDEERGHCRYAAEHVDLCFTGTIDSFCNMVLNEHPAEAGIPGNAVVNADDVLRSAMVREYLRAAEGLYGPELQQKYRRLCVYQSQPTDVVRKAANKLMELRNTEFIYNQPKGMDFDSDYAVEKQKLVESLSYFLQHSEFLYRKNQGSIGAYNTLRDRFRVLQGSWDGKLPDVLYLLSAIKDLQLIPPGADEEQWHPELLVQKGKKTVTLAYDLDSETSLYRLMKEEQYAVTMDFLSDFVAACAETLQRNGELSFFDFLLRLRDTLKADAEADGRLIRHIYQRHSYYLIDEFQDTNPLQAEIFFYLCAENPVPVWSECVPRPGSLFVVGDPKQSIYRFRGADVASYFKVQSLFRENGGQLLTLYKNFRSTPVMCSGFNRVFSEKLPENTAVQSKYQPIPLEDAAGECSTGWYYFDTDYDAVPTDAAWIIRSMVDDPSFKIYDSKKELTRRVEYRDFMLITRGKSALKPLLQTLTGYGIPCRTEGSTLFTECRLLQVLTGLLAGIADPNNSTAVYGALMSGAFAISDNDVTAWRQAGHSLQLYQNDEKLKEQPICRALETLNQYRGQLRYEPASVVCRRMLNELRLPERVGAENLEYTMYALELLAGAERKKEVLTAKESADYLREIASDASDTERCFSIGRDDNQVHLANLHKVKGLEAPIVILAGPRAKDIPFTAHTDYISNQPSTVIFTLKGSGDYGNYGETRLYPEREALEQENKDAEKERLLYVAATRAANLLLVPRVRTKKTGKLASYFWSTLLDGCRGNLTEILPMDEEHAPEIPEKETASAKQLLDQAETAQIYRDFDGSARSFTEFQPSTLKRVKTKFALDTNEEGTAVEVAADPAHAHAALLGTMVHKLMEILVSSGTDAPAEELADTICLSYDLEQGTETVLKQAIIKVCRQIRAGGYPQKNSPIADILSELRSADQVFCEVPFSVRISAASGAIEVCNGIMDVVYCKAGAWHIVDYKTNADGTNLDAEYRQQLAAYQHAFAEITGETADARTYHIDI